MSFNSQMINEIPEEARGWFSGKEFTNNTAETRIGNWMHVLAPYREHIHNVLEIGSWEGMSALFWLNYFDCHLTCIDTFAGSGDEHAGYDVAGNEGRFDRNLAPFADRVTKLKGHSTNELGRLGEDKKRFHLIYVDGAHHQDQVRTDTLLGWELLRVGGIIIWDDYGYGGGGSGVVDAVDSFIALTGEAMQIINRNYQIIGIRR